MHQTGRRQAPEVARRAVEDGARSLAAPLRK